MIDQSVDVTLGETVYKLQPTLAAIEKINNEFSSLADCGTRVMRFDFKAIAFVISAGASLSAQQTASMKPELIGRLSVAVEQIQDYLQLLAKGGVDRDEEPEQGEA